MPRPASVAVLTAIVAFTGTPVSAKERIPDDALPPAYIVHTLSAAGYVVRAITVADGVYVVDLGVSGEGVHRATVDPRDGRLPPPVPPGRNPRYGLSAAGHAASDAVQMAASAGYPDFTELAIRGGTYEMAARDTEGRAVTLSIDPRTGAVQPLSRPD